jgi:uncharacterized protein YcfJ
MLAVAALMALSLNSARAQDPVAGAILGGAAGAIFGGAISGRGEGAAIGAIIGATTGAIIADQGRRNQRGYYAYNNGCYIQRRDGAWIRVHPRYCY